MLTAHQDGTQTAYNSVLLTEFRQYALLKMKSKCINIQCYIIFCCNELNVDTSQFEYKIFPRGASCNIGSLLLWPKIQH